MMIEQAIDDLMDTSRTIAEVAESESDEANRINAQNCADDCKQIAEWLRELAERRKAPEVVFCKDCRKHNVKVGFDENFHTVWKEDACPLVDWRGKAKEHEFDYQYCAFAERRTDD